MFGDLDVPGVDFAADDTADAFACWMGSGAVLRTCGYGSQRPDAVRFAIVGDSHAASLLPGLIGRLEARNWRLDTYVGWGCQWAVASSLTDCSRAMVGIQSTLPAYDAVITTASRATAGHDAEGRAEAMAGAWRPVVSSGTRVVVIGDNPVVSRGALDCVARLGTSLGDGDCGMDRLAATSAADPLLMAAAAVPQVHVVQTADWYCGPRRCPMSSGGVLLHRDTASHLTASFSATLGPRLAAAIASAL